MAFSFLAILLAAYVALMWHCTGNFAQHHVLGQVRRRWALYAAKTTLFGLKFLLPSLLLGGGFYRLELQQDFLALLIALPMTVGFFSIFAVAPACLAFSLLVRLLELLCGTSMGSSSQKVGIGLSACRD